MVNNLLVLAQEDWGVGPNVFWTPGPYCVAITVAWIAASGWFVVRKFRG